MGIKTKKDTAERIRLLKEVIRLFATAREVEQETDPLVFITIPVLNCKMAKFKSIYKRLLKLQKEISHD